MLNSRKEMTEERLSELEDRATEITKSGELRKRKDWGGAGRGGSLSLRNLWDNIKRTNLCF